MVSAASGHSLQIVGRRKSVHVRNAPKATAGGQGVVGRDGAQPDIIATQQFLCPPLLEHQTERLIISDLESSLNFVGCLIGRIGRIAAG